MVDVASTDTDVMDRVVQAAAGLARPGDVVLLAPAAASMDLFRDYAARGDAFADAVRRLPGRRAGRVTATTARREPSARRGAAGRRPRAGSSARCPGWPGWTPR